MVNLPCASVVVPVVVPLTSTEAPATGWLFVSVTLPETVLCWANAKDVMKHRHRIVHSRNAVSLTSIIVFNLSRLNFRIRQKVMVRIFLHQKILQTSVKKIRQVKGQQLQPLCCSDFKKLFFYRDDCQTLTNKIILSSFWDIPEMC